MSVNVLINRIRESKRRAKIWDTLTNEQKRTFIASLEGSEWHLDELLEDFAEICRGK